MSREPTDRRIGPDELQRRTLRVRRLAAQVGFVGFVEYRHVHSQSGGAQFGLGPDPRSDLLTVYAEAFVRDANPNDFSLTAIVAHERGHQIAARHPQVERVTRNHEVVVEEVFASILGAAVVGPGRDRDDLLEKALVELVATGVKGPVAVRVLGDLWALLEPVA